MNILIPETKNHFAFEKFKITKVPVLKWSYIDIDKFDLIIPLREINYKNYYKSNLTKAIVPDEKMFDINPMWSTTSYLHANKIIQALYKIKDKK
jgi:hypothetical protein